MILIKKFRRDESSRVRIQCHNEVTAWCISVLQKTDPVELEISTAVPANVHKTNASRLPVAFVC